jgi:hypothetical protein
MLHDELKSLVSNPEFDPLENDFRGDTHNYSQPLTNDDGIDEGVKSFLRP